MKISVKVEIAPFKVPDKVDVKGSGSLKQAGFTDQRTLHLSELDLDTLGKLCDEFRVAVFKKAGEVRRSGACPVVPGEF